MMIVQFTELWRRLACFWSVGGFVGVSEKFSSRLASSGRGEGLSLEFGQLFHCFRTYLPLGIS